MRRRRYQNPEPKRRKHGHVWVWVVQYRDLDGIARTKVLGRCSQMSKGEAQAMVAAILQPINAGVARRQPVPMYTFEQFVVGVYIRVCRRKNKPSTMMTTEPLVQRHLVEPLGARLLQEITREQMQALLDVKAATLSRSVVDHLRWQLRAIYRLAISEGAVQFNPADALFTGRCKLTRERRDLSAADIRRLLAALGLRERLMAELAIFGGMRPGEFLALKWVHIGDEFFAVRQRLYRGDIDSPKSPKSVRIGGMSPNTQADMKAWRELAGAAGPEAWVFPSENFRTPLSRDNVWRRYFKPKLDKIGLGWATFQVMRRANVNLGRKAGIDDKVAADQRGHGLGVSLGVYADSPLDEKVAAVRKLEATVM